MQREECISKGHKSFTRCRSQHKRKVVGQNDCGMSHFACKPTCVAKDATHMKAKHMITNLFIAKHA